MNRRRQLLTALLATALLPWPADARDYRDARRKREKGEIVPLRQVIKRAQGRRPGRVVDVELQKRGRRDVYRIEMLQRNGDVEVMRYDARTGEPIGR